MTEDQLREELQTTYDIYNFCIENDFYDFIEDWVIDIDSYLDEQLKDNVSYFLDNHYWHELVDKLSYNDRGYDVYLVNNEEWFRLDEIDTSFNDYLGDLIEMLQSCGFLDSEDDEEENDSTSCADDDDDDFNPVLIMMQENQIEF